MITDMKKIMAVLMIMIGLLVFSSSVNGFNITYVLGRHKRFSTLNALLSTTGLADEINSRRTITVLAFDNAAASSLATAASPSAAVVKEILSAHVILDYYDVEKLTRLAISNNISTLTTLFQASGAATAFPGQGSLHVSLLGEGEIAFGSAAPGGVMASKLVETVAAKPYNISVLQITAPIRVPGISLGVSPLAAPPALPPVAAPKSAVLPPPPPPPPVHGVYDDVSAPPFMISSGGLGGSGCAAAVLVAWCLVATF